MNLNDVYVSVTGDEAEAIGALFFYSIQEVKIKREDLAALFDKTGVDKAYLPKQIRPSDAFRRVTTDHGTKKRVPASGAYQNYIVREVAADSKMIVRNIVVETVHPDNETLDYESTANKIRFIKEKDGLGTIELNPDPQFPLAKELGEMIKTEFYNAIQYYESQQIRTIVMRIINGLLPTPINKGTYLIPPSKIEEMKQLKNLINELHEDDPAGSFPIFNTADGIETIHSKFKAELRDALKRCKELERQDAPKRQLDLAIDEARKAGIKYKEYKNHLSTDVTDLDNMLNELRISAVNLTMMLTD